MCIALWYDCFIYDGMITNVKEINPWLYRYEHLTTGKYRSVYRWIEACFFNSKVGPATLYIYVQTLWNQKWRGGCVWLLWRIVWVRWNCISDERRWRGRLWCHSPFRHEICLKPICFWKLRNCTYEPTKHFNTERLGCWVNRSAAVFGRAA